MIDQLNKSTEKKHDWFQLTEIGKKFSGLGIKKPSFVLGIREAFSEKVREILDEQKKIKRGYEGLNDEKKAYYDAFLGGTNGDILINPEFEEHDGEINVADSQIGYYQTYHAYNGLKNNLGEGKILKDVSEKINYKVLSAGGLIFDKESENFILFKRPEDSQEAPGKIDLIGGCMNMRDGLDEDGKPNPAKFTSSRISHKTGIKIDSKDFNLLGIQGFEKRGFYNIVYLGFVDGVESDETKQDNYSKIHICEVENYIKQDNPGGSGLLLSLSHPYFEKYGWGAERVKEIEGEKGLKKYV